MAQVTRDITVFLYNCIRAKKFFKLLFCEINKCHKLNGNEEFLVKLRLLLYA